MNETEKPAGMFSGLASLRQKSTTAPDETRQHDEARTRVVAPTRTASSAPRVPRTRTTATPARRNDPQYTQMSAHVNESLYSEVKMRLIKHERVHEMGPLLDELLQRWIAEGTP